MSATVIPFERRSEKADQAGGPASIGLRRQNRSARLLCLGSALYGFAVAAAIEADVMPIAIALIVGAFFVLRRLR